MNYIIDYFYPDNTDNTDKTENMNNKITFQEINENINEYNLIHTIFKIGDIKYRKYSEKQIKDKIDFICKNHVFFNKDKLKKLTKLIDFLYEHNKGDDCIDFFNSNIYKNKFRKESSRT